MLCYVMLCYVMLCYVMLCYVMLSLSHVHLFANTWIVAHQAPLSMGFSRQEYWSGLPFPSPGDLPNPGIKPRSPTLQADSLLSEPPGKHWTNSTVYVKQTLSFILGLWNLDSLQQGMPMWIALCKISAHWSLTNFTCMFTTCYWGE